MNNEIKININLQDLLILQTGVQKYLKLYPKTEATDKVNAKLEKAFNQIINTKNK